MELQRGQRMALEQLVVPGRPWVVGIQADIPGATVDCVGFGLDNQGRVADERYMVFYNQPRTPCGGVSLAAPPGALAGFEMDLERLPVSIDRLILVITAEEDADFSRMTFGEVQLIQAGKVAARLGLESGMFSGERALILVECYRRGTSWRLTAVGQGFAGGLAALAQHFGVDTSGSGDASSPPLPPVSLLPLDDVPPAAGELAWQEATLRAIERTLSDFGVKGSIVGAEGGPVVTTYALNPAPGMKISRVVGLEPELALALANPGLRIDPLFDHGVIGIEIPNRERAVVPLRRLMADESLGGTEKPLLLPLGVDTKGRPVVEDLEELPHLLVAGTTRSGKSVALHGMVCSLLLRTSIRTARLVLVDPKRNEFVLYDGVPHLLAPVVTETHHAIAALHWLTEEMSSRYQQMNGLGVRNMEEWRIKAMTAERESPRGSRGGEPVPLPLPSIVVIVDELADLMLQSNRAAEKPLVRLAQMGRACGIHLVLATQRPSREVLTGLIKSNIPARLAFKVTSRIDSRIILDEGGADNLLGRGDGLFIAPGRALQRLQAPMVTEGNITAIVRFLKSTTPAMPDPLLMACLESARG